jgi:glycosyltransferase involved in cell wall biosynthesis
MQNTYRQVQVAEEDVLAPAPSSSDVVLSFVVPMMNEERNVPLFFTKLSSQVQQTGLRYEVLFIDDGSTDGTFRELEKLYQQTPDIVRVVRFRRNFGKTAALVAGFSRCRGRIIFTMDGDLQDDPDEIPRYLAKIDEGYDLVSGWKFPRHDPFSKTFPSRIFNWLVSKMTNVHLHDINNGFKAYRREVIEDPQLKLYGDFHRFIPVIAVARGFRVAEIKVRHHPRQYGTSKFGTKRFAQGLIDLLNVLFLTTFLRKPLRLFVPLGFWTFFAGFLVDLWVVVKSYFITHQFIHNQPLLFGGILLMIFGVQIVLAGFQSEMIRHYAFQRGEEYSIRQELD